MPKKQSRGHRRRQTRRGKKRKKHYLMNYYYNLKTQAKQKKVRPQRLPVSLIRMIQPMYTINLNKIRYYTPLKLIDDKAVTFGYEIFFPSNMNLHWLLHEIHHVQQYADHANQRHGSILPFLKKYQRQSLRRRSSKIWIPYEDEAEKKADSIYTKRNRKKLCKYPVLFPCRDG